MTDKEKLEKCIRALQSIPFAEGPGDMLWIARKALGEIKKPCNDGKVNIFDNG